MKSAIKLVGFGLAMTCLSAAAEDTPSFDAIDSNADGAISSVEASSDARMAAAFTEADSNQDGLVSREEFVAYWQAR